MRAAGAVGGRAGARERDEAHVVLDQHAQQARRRRRHQVREVRVLELDDVEVVAVEPELDLVRA